MTPHVVQFDWERFQARVERLREQHAARTPDDAAAASMAAFKRWGVKPPRSFTHAHDHAARRGDDDGNGG